MKIACITFTYPKDAFKAFIGSHLLPKEWDIFWAVDEKDKDMPVPSNVKKIITTFDRGHHLNSKEMIYGFIDILQHLSNEYDIILKLDSDTSLYKPECFINPIIDSHSDFVYIRRTPNEYITPISNGICYSFSKRCISYMLNVDYTKLIMIHNGSEDSIISHFLSSIHPWPLISQIDKSRIDWSTNSFIDEKAIAGHYGYINNNEMFDRTNEILKLQGRTELSIAELINSQFTQDFQRFMASQKKA